MDEIQTILREVAALSSHYPVSTKSPADQARWLSDFADDLGDLGADAVTKACRAYRLSEAKRFPTPGALRKLAVERIAALPAPDARPAEVWRPLNDEAYDRAPLSEKIRHHQNMASEANLKAAVLWRRLPEARAGNPPSFLEPPSNDPGEWAIWRRREMNHNAEAKRLKAILKTAKEPA